MGSDVKKTKVDLVTGFLGSGKTTFIRDYAGELIARGERIGIIENDYGAINIDLMLLHRELGDRCRLEMVIGGDADCHRRRLKTKLIAMGIDHFDRVIVEPSGVFDVEEFSDILYEEPLDHLMEMNNVLTVVDGEMLINETYSENGRYLLAEQLTKAGAVLISKAEQASEEELDRALDHLNASLKNAGCSRRFKPEELIIRRLPGELSVEEWKKLISAGHRDFAYIKRRVVEDGAFTPLFFFHPELPEEPVDELMKKIFEDPANEGLVRIKGFVPVKSCFGLKGKQEGENEWLEINATRRHTELRVSPVGQPVLIAIGEDIREEIIGSYLRSYENEYRS